MTQLPYMDPYYTYDHTAVIQTYMQLVAYVMMMSIESPMGHPRECIHKCFDLRTETLKRCHIKEKGTVLRDVLVAGHGAVVLPILIAPQ